VERRDDRLVLALLMLAAAALQLPGWAWEVEDAGVGAAYARSVASGFGLVPQIGAERVEGFSNPLWIAMLAVGASFGLDPLVVGRIAGVVLGCVALPTVYAAMLPVAARAPLVSQPPLFAGALGTVGRSHRPLPDAPLAAAAVLA
jgi:hypothetical protein